VSLRVWKVCALISVIREFVGRSQECQVCRVHVLGDWRGGGSAYCLSHLGIIGREVDGHVHTSIQSNRMTYKHMHRM